MKKDKGKLQKIFARARSKMQHMFQYVNMFLFGNKKIIYLPVCALSMSEKTNRQINRSLLNAYYLLS